MKIIDEGLFIKLLPDDRMVLTDVAAETMRSMEIDLGKSDSPDNYKNIPIEPDSSEPTSEDYENALKELGVDLDD